MKLFISYRRTSWPFAHHMAEKLRHLINCDIFIDYQDIDEPDFERSILRHLMESSAVLLVVSKDTFSDRIWEDNDWVRREIRTALQHRKPLIPVCIDGILPPPHLPSDIRDVQYRQCIMFYPDYYESALRRLAEFVTRVVPNFPNWAEATRLSRPERERRTGPLNAYAAIGQEAALQDAIRTLQQGDFEKAVFLLEMLREARFQPSMPSLSIDSLLQEAHAGLNRLRLSREARTMYESVAALAGSSATHAQARAAWNEFRRQYPDHRDDPANLAERLKQPTALDRFVSVLAPPQKDQSTAVRRPSAPAAPTLPMLEWVKIPAGVIHINGQAYQLEPYALSRYPVTNEQFNLFVQAPDGYADQTWWDFSPDSREWRRKHAQPRPATFSGALNPREMVSWFEAVAFTRWLAARTGLPVALPSEMQWQRAAQGDDFRVYPWGNTFETARCNTYESGLGKTTPVTRYTNGASPYGVQDMVGNVLEWCLNLYDLPHDCRLESLGVRALRGGSWAYYALNARISTRYADFPQSCYSGVGFRLALVQV